jgi:hypothetical protein
VSALLAVSVDSFDPHVHIAPRLDDGTQEFDRPAE